MAQRYAAHLKQSLQRWGRWLNSPPGRGVIKCSIAYTIASLATFASPLSDFLGRPGGKHVVATMTVYFHPARSAGSMIEAILIAIVAVAYAELLSLLSMATSVLVGAVWGRVTLAHVFVVVWVGCGFGFMAWTKQKLSNPLVNVACTLSSLAVISVVTKENAVVDNVFSNQKIVQVLKMLVMGITSTAAVNLLIWRVSARALLRGSMTKVSVSLANMLAMITTGFISGSEDDSLLREFSAASSAYSSLYPQMMKNLREAKFEHYVVGHEKLYALERSTVLSMEKLAQSIGGLRSASNTLFGLLLQDHPRVPQHPTDEDNYFPLISPSVYLSEAYSWGDYLPKIEDVATSSEACSASDFFDLFASSLRSPMVALTTELSGILRATHFDAGSGTSSGDGHSSHALADALGAFNTARIASLQELYEHPALRGTGSQKVQAGLEQVAAACGHFTFSLQSFAEKMQTHLDILEDLRQIRARGKRSWLWMRWWTKGKKDVSQGSQEEEGLVKPIRKSAVPKGIPDSMVKRRDTFGWDAAPTASRIVAAVSQHVLRMVRKIAKDDNMFGLKVGIGASLWAMLAFLNATRETYMHFRAEWGLLSFMIVCSMTVGASNTTGSSRFAGTLIGAVFSLFNWYVSQGNAVALVFLGWLVSLWNFYLIVACGREPLGRMTQLSYNVSTLYAYSLAAGLDSDDGDDEGGGGVEPNMTEIVKHRVLSVTCGILWGLIICRVIWPISARKKFQEGISVLCLQMGLIWKRGPLAILLSSEASRSYLKSGEQAALQRYASRLESLRQSAASEFELRGPFPFEAYGRVLRSTRRILEGFNAMSLVAQHSEQLTAGEKVLLQYTAIERAVLCDRICHIFQVVASSMMLEYPLTNAVPNIVALQNNLLSKVFRFRNTGPGGDMRDSMSIEQGSSTPDEQGESSTGAVTHITVEEQDYALLYAYVLVTGQVADELKIVEKEIERLYGVLDESTALLQ